jgi:transposase
MSLSFEPILPVPPETVRVAQAAFPKGNPYLTLRDELGPIFGDADFACLFSTTGQPAVPPWQLALVTLMQFRENLSDRQAAEAVRSRIDWKYVLGLELTDAGFDFSVLSEFRQRLIEHNASELLLERLLEHCRQVGLIRARGKQRTDSTRVLASIRTLNRLELMAETLRAVLNDLATIAPDWVRQIAPSAWYKRYGQRIEDSRLPEATEKREAYAQIVGADGYYLLDCLAQANMPLDWEALPTVVALKATWECYYERKVETQSGEQSVRWKTKQELKRAGERIESPYDLEARYRSRADTAWTGYMVHFSETCDDDQCHLMTHVVTTPATIHEIDCTAPIHQALIDKELAPQEHFVDSAYVDAQLLVSSPKQGITLVGPARPNGSWQSRKHDAFALSQFQVDWQHQQAICPQGKRSTSWVESVDHTGSRYIKVRFYPQDCANCPVRSQCTKVKPGGVRSLKLKPQEEYEALKAARAVHATEAWQQRYKRRAGIEGTISQAVRAFGLRQTRYRGLAKTHLQNLAIAAAMNLDRLINWLNGIPRAKTRLSRFAALAEA